MASVTSCQSEPVVCCADESQCQCTHWDGVAQDFCLEGFTVVESCTAATFGDCCEFGDDFCVCKDDQLGCSEDGGPISDCRAFLDGGSSATGGAPSGSCSAKETGTTMAPCDVDSDCYSGFCDETGNPGPYCFVPTSAVLADGRAYACSSDQECADVASDFVARGGTAICHGGEPDIYDGCEFRCDL